MELFRPVYFDGGKQYTENWKEIFLEKLDNMEARGHSQQQGGSKHESTISSYLLFPFNH